MQIETIVFDYQEGDGCTYTIDYNVTVAVPEGKTEWFKEVIRQDIDTLRNQNQAYRETARKLREKAGNFKSLNKHSHLIHEGNMETMLKVFEIERKIITIDVEDVIRKAIKTHSLEEYQKKITCFSINVDNIDSPNEDIFF